MRCRDTIRPRQKKMRFVGLQCVRDKRKCVLYAYNTSAKKENAFCTPTMHPRQKKMRFVRLQCVIPKIENI